MALCIPTPSFGKKAARLHPQYPTIASAFQNQTHTLGEFWGAQLRTYWRKYEGVTRLGGNFAYALGGGISLNLHGENLLDYQTGEPDNITVVPGRTITGGLKISF